jgi:hypothetical protein
MGPRPMMAMPGMPYHMGMSMSMSSIPSAMPTPSMGIKASPADLQLKIHRPQKTWDQHGLSRHKGQTWPATQKQWGHHVPLCIGGAACSRQNLA